MSHAAGHGSVLSDLSQLSRHRPQVVHPFSTVDRLRRTILVPPIAFAPVNVT